MISFINTPAEKKRVIWQNPGELLVISVFTVIFDKVRKLEGFLHRSS